MSFEQGKRIDVQPARPMVDRKLRIKRSLYRFLGALGVMTLLVACGDISVEPSVNQPVIVNTEAAPTQEAETGAGDPPDPEDNEEVEITVQVPAPTDEPVATVTPEADPTRAAVSEIVGFAALSPADQEVLISWAGNANLGVLGSPESFSILNACHLVVTADFPEGSSYNRGDHIVKTPDGGYFIFTSWALDDDGNTVEVDELGYNLVLTDLAGNPVVEYSPGQTRASWVGPNGELFIFEPISGTFITVDELNYRIDLMSAQSYFFDVVEVEYEDGVAYGLDASGNRIAQEDGTGAWVEVQPAREWLFGPDERLTYEFADMMEIPAGTMALVQTDAAGWQYVPYNSSAVLNLLNLTSADQILAPGEMNQLTQGVLNTETIPARLDSGIGTNRQLFRVAPFIIRGEYRWVLPNKPDLTSVGIVGYTWSTDQSGNPLLIAEQISVTLEGISQQTTRDYASGVNPDGSISFTRSGAFPAHLWKDGNGAPFNTFEEFIAYCSANPDSPVIAYMLGTAPDPSMTGLGQAHLRFDTGSFDPNANYQNTLQFPAASSAISFAGMYVPQDPTQGEN